MRGDPYSLRHLDHQVCWLEVLIQSIDVYYLALHWQGAQAVVVPHLVLLGEIVQRQVHEGLLEPHSKR